MATARSEISARQCEDLIKKSLKYVKKLDLEERIYKSQKSGSFNVYTSFETAIDELGKTIILDLINQSLRYRIEVGENLFSISSLGETELEILKKDYDKKIIDDFWAGKRSRGKGKKTIEQNLHPKMSSLSKFKQGEESPDWLKRDEKIQEEARIKAQKMYRIEKEKEWKEQENEERQNQVGTSSRVVKRSLDADPDEDLKSEDFVLDSLDVRKLKNVEVKQNKDGGEE